MKIREYAREAQLHFSVNLTSHAFRRGMAQDIVDAGGSLAELLRAGGWNSNAFLYYLRDTQVQDVAVSQMVVLLSDTEDDS